MLLSRHHNKISRVGLRALWPWWYSWVKSRQKKPRCWQFGLKTSLRSHPNTNKSLNLVTLVVVLWSAWLPSTPSVPVWMLLKSTNLLFEKNKNEPQEARDGPLKKIYLRPWSPLVEGDEQPYQPHQQAMQSMKINVFGFSCKTSFLNLIYHGAGTVVHLLLLKVSMCNVMCSLPTKQFKKVSYLFLPKFSTK